ncbi:MAG: tRNA dimethylallyltransferase [Chlamydiia bacterium]|nr:tRNA dimethylallyltransferase [Chlamydiia bacterium]
MSAETLNDPKNRPWYQPQKERLPEETGRKKVILLAGPTASGKSALAIRLAKAIGAEIISCDSMQVYRGLNIGTAKCSSEERAEVPHHLIDIRDVDESFSVVDFYREATDAFRSITLKDKPVVVTGGTGFYMRTFIYGPPQTPPSSPEVREHIEGEFDKFGPEFMFEKLKSVDPDYAQTITIHDRQKIIRAFEIIMVTGGQVSQIPVQSVEDIPKDIDFRCWFIYHPKEILYDRINKRCDEMLQNGLLDEVARMIPKGLRDNPSTARAIGYRQCLEFLSSPQSERDYEHLQQSFKKASRLYAKRQFTWYRGEPMFRWVDLSQYSAEQVEELILRDFEQS